MARPRVRRSFLEEAMSQLNLDMKKVCKTQGEKNVLSRETERTKDVWNSKRGSLLPQGTVTNAQCYRH